MRTSLLLLSVLCLSLQNSFAQKSTISEEMMEMNTYSFSDPDPVAKISRIYPYYRFDGYTNEPALKKWKMVILENDYIKVYVCPDIGGKVWGAIEKSTGKEFLYFNHVVKFRDIAMRGPWTSGGLEFNFGDIGHIPTCATPVDYEIKENMDGSVSCVVGAIDLPSGSKWNIEISVHPDKAYFETTVHWSNSTSLPGTYYHWMNAAAKSAGNLEFIYPGSNWIGHGGEVGTWPRDNGRDVNYYENNNFGTYKSYHVLNSYSEFFGGYYHDDNFGFGHLCSFDEKPGKKLWIWGLSQQGMIWEDLLTDDDGQYIEFQAGKLFNQAAFNSTGTPFKHKEFAPYDVDVMRELWFPLKETGGMVGASSFGVLNIEGTDLNKQILFSALQTVNDVLLIKENGEIVSETELKLKPLENKQIEFSPKSENFTVYLASGKLLYSSNPIDNSLDRPIDSLPEFNWESAYGLFTKGLELEKQRMYAEAMASYKMVLETDPGFLPAMSRLALGYYRKMDYNKALEMVTKALRIDAYDSESNYFFGLISKKLGMQDESKSGFSIAAASVDYRAASYVELSKIYFKNGDYSKSLDYAVKSLSFNVYNPVAYQIMAIVYRKTGSSEEAESILDRLFELDATNHFIRFEKFLMLNTEEAKNQYKSHITNELPYESYIDLAIFYSDLNCNDEAVKVLSLSPDYPVRDIWLAHLDSSNSESHIEKVISGSPELVFPFRNETAEILKQLIQQNDNWKLKYYLGLIYWNRGLEEKALDLFEECGSAPDFAPLYLAKANLIKDPERQTVNVLKAYELDKEDWRSALALVKQYLSDGKAETALPIVEKFKNKYPEQSAIGLAYARTLMELNKSEESIKFLETYYVLPFEGATDGRDLYHEACLKVANEALSTRQFKTAILYAEKALVWPVNLGVGRPYDVDEGTENQIFAKAYEGMGKKKKAAEYMDKVVK